MICMHEAEQYELASWFSITGTGRCICGTAHLLLFHLPIHLQLHCWPAHSIAVGMSGHDGASAQDGHAHSLWLGYWLVYMPICMVDDVLEPLCLHPWLCSTAPTSRGTRELQRRHCSSRPSEHMLFSAIGAVQE